MAVSPVAKMCKPAIKLQKDKADVRELESFSQKIILSTELIAAERYLWPRIFFPSPQN